MSIFTEKASQKFWRHFSCPALGHVLLSGTGSASPESKEDELKRITAGEVTLQGKSILGRHTKVRFSKYGKNVAS